MRAFLVFFGWAFFREMMLLVLFQPNDCFCKFASFLVKACRSRKVYVLLESAALGVGNADLLKKLFRASCLEPWDGVGGVSD